MQSTNATEPTIIDVRPPDAASPASNEVLSAIFEGLNKPPGQRSLPTLLLYDEEGLKLYDEITTSAHEYYLFAAELNILKAHSDEIVRAMGAGKCGEHIVLELGAG